MNMKMTQDIQHHLSDAMLMAYSAGTLPEAFNLMVATHISMCDQCRAQVEAYDALGGALLEDPIAPAALSAGSLEATLAMITAAPPEPPRKRIKPGVLPQPLQDYVGGDIDNIRWRPVGMGAKQAILKTGPGGSARMLFIPAGSAMPDHGHHGQELTLVLKGAFTDDGHRFGRGDVEAADEHTHHTPIAELGEDCICLAVTDAPLRFKGLIPRLAQPFLRI